VVISYHLPVAGQVSLDICDVTGRKVESLSSQEKQAGDYSVNWESTALPNGVYFVKLTAGELEIARKLIVAR
jgi:flagellar hook assembly protein FlgD